MYSVRFKYFQLEELEARANILKKELETIHQDYKRAVDDCEDAHQRIRSLEEFINEPIKCENDQELYEALVDKLSSLENLGQETKQRIKQHYLN